jgi:hypothetical protein
LDLYHDSIHPTRKRSKRRNPGSPATDAGFRNRLAAPLHDWSKRTPSARSTDSLTFPI